MLPTRADIIAHTAAGGGPSGSSADDSCIFLRGRSCEKCLIHIRGGVDFVGIKCVVVRDLVGKFFGVEDAGDDEGKIVVVVVFFALREEIADTLGGCFQRWAVWELRISATFVMEKAELPTHPLRPLAGHEDVLGQRCSSRRECRTTSPMG